MNAKIVFVLLFCIIGAFALDPICKLPKKPSEDEPMCRALIYSYYYNTATNKCERFLYGGCFGNENNFPTEEACKSKCH